MEYFKRVAPESVGVASKGILSFLDDINRKGIELHSLMVIRHGQCCAAGWWAPYGPEYLHPLYSFSKSLTATAIGFAEQEGILSLSERLVDIFPGELPENPSENLKEATIHHLLCMSCGHETGMMDDGPDWIRSFLAHPFPHRPGTFFKYNTAGTNMLAAILQRKTGQSVTQFLKPRLLDPLGITQIVCHRLADPDHVEMGGAGMKLTTEDMARFTYFMLQRGSWEGKQLLNRDWFDRAASKQMETEGDSEHHVKEWAKGYGYQCWMCSLPGSFRADGAYGQFGFVYPTLDLCVIITAATEQTQSIVDSMMDHLIPAVNQNALPEANTSGELPASHPQPGAASDALPESADAIVLAHRLDHLHIPALTSCRNPEVEQKLSSVSWIADQDTPCSSMEVLIGGSGLFDIADGEITEMSFVFHENSVDWICLEKDREKKVTASLANTFALSECNGHVFAATARWRSYFALELEVRRMDALSGTRLIFRLDKNTLTIDADNTLISFQGMGVPLKKLAPFYR